MDMLLDKQTHRKTNVRYFSDIQDLSTKKMRQVI